MAWDPIIRQPGEGEKILFRIGLMTFKVSSALTDGHFAICETELPPGCNVEQHQHPEAEVFYIIAGQFEFTVGAMEQPVSCGPGSFISVPPNVPHAFGNTGTLPGKILGMLMPADPNGLESLFLKLGIPISAEDNIPDLSQPVEHLQEFIARRRQEMI